MSKLRRVLTAGNYKAIVREEANIFVGGVIGQENLILQWKWDINGNSLNGDPAFALVWRTHWN